MNTRLILVLCAICMLAACENPKMALKVTRTGGANTALLKTTQNGQPSMRDIAIGDTVVVSPGNQRTVVASTPMTYTLYEDGQLTSAELKKELTVNRKEGPKIEFIKGELKHGDFFVHDIYIDLHSANPDDFSRTISYLVFNRGDKPFRGDLTIYDMLPAELQFGQVNAVSKFVDHREMKNMLGYLPIIQYVTFAMDSYAKLDEQVPMKHDQLDQVHKYTFQRLVLEPGQAVGFSISVRYVVPPDQDLAELREEAHPIHMDQH